jgi:hypothetical protein
VQSQFNKVQQKVVEMVAAKSKEEKTKTDDL